MKKLVSETKLLPEMEPFEDGKQLLLTILEKLDVYVQLACVLAGIQR